MKPKTVISLLAAVLILAAASYFLLSNPTHKDQKNKMGAAFMQDFPINKIASITIRSTEDTVELLRGPSVWQVKNRFEYPADFSKISDFIKKIDRLKIGRTFEADDEALGRQKLFDPADEKAEDDQKGVRVTLADETGKTISDLILGKDRRGSPGGSGQYLRHADEKTVYLVSNSFSFLEQKPAEWLETEVISIGGQEIAAVNCYAKDSDQVLYRLERKKTEQAPELLSPPQEGSVDSNKIDQVFEALSPLNIEDISGPPRQADAPPPTGTARLEYQLKDGRIVNVFPASQPTDKPEDQTYQVTLTVGYAAPKTPPPSEAPQKDKNEGTDTAAEKSETEQDEKAKSPENVKKEASALNDKLKVWTFEIAKWQFDSFITAKEGLLETEEENNPPQ